MTVQEQINTWVTPGILGFYQSCEMTVCGLLDKRKCCYNPDFFREDRNR